MIAYHELTDLWRKFGGKFHGPNIETGTMPESILMPFLQTLVGPDQNYQQIVARLRDHFPYKEIKAVIPKEPDTESRGGRDPCGHGDHGRDYG